MRTDQTFIFTLFQGVHVKSHSLSKKAVSFAKHTNKGVRRVGVTLRECGF